MKLQYIFVTLLALFRIGAASHESRSQYGLGISLSGGYATISAFKNGTYIDIAKVEGGEKYTALMLGSDLNPDESISGTYCPFPRTICKFWPFQSVQVHNPLAPMFKALITAAEAALETNIDSVIVSAYDVGNRETFKPYSVSALKELGIDAYPGLEHDARRVGWALDIRGNCYNPVHLSPDHPDFYEDPEQLIFSIEYTRRSMTASLWSEDCGNMDCLSRIHDPTLGLDGIKACRRTEKDGSSCEKRFESALHNVSRGLIRPNETIHAVLLMGEGANDQILTTALRNVLKTQFSNGESIDFSKVRELSPDLAFAGSRASARFEWEVKEDWPGYKMEL